MPTAIKTAWKPAQANDLKWGAEVRIQYHEGPFQFEGRVTQKWRGWDALISSGEPYGVFRICKGFSDWGTYDVFVRDLP